MSTITNDTMKKANGMASDFKSKAPSFESSWENATTQAGEKLGALTSTVTGRAADYIKNGQEYVRQNPAQGVAMAAAAGMVAGSLLTIVMRSSRKH